MPTGFTCDIKDGITFERFALNCARAFGALINMRDDSLDAEIPDEIKPSDHHVKALAEAEKEKKILENIHDSQIEKAAIKYNKTNQKEYERRLAENKDLFSKYQIMLKQVENWTPPTDNHDNLKKFMIEQIMQSVKFDCYDQTMPTKLTPNKWYKEKLKKCSDDIKYHTEELKKEQDRCKNKTDWIRALKTSLKEK